MLELPLPRNELTLADWLELQALSADDKNASLGDLERALVRESPAGDAEVECQDVLTEIQTRSDNAEHGYPFEIDGSVLRSKGVLAEYLAYTFSLCLSFLPWRTAGHPDRLFERLATAAAGNFVHGDGVKFSTPRTELSRGFVRAIDELCRKIGEGGGWRSRPGAVGNHNDDTVDVVAWRNFPDQKNGKLLLFGQCAAGNNWKTKTDELQPHRFCEEWMQEVPQSQVVRAFFIPHRVSGNQWAYYVRRAGIIFDRCRIAYHIDSSTVIEQRSRILRWTERRLEEVKS